MDEILFENSEMSVVNRDGYIFTHTNNSVVYVLPYRQPQQGAYLLGRFEVCPAHGPQKKLCAITGQCAPGADPLHVAAKELHEEGGFVIDPARLAPLGSGYLTKQADTLAHFFSVDVTGLPRGEAPSDGSKFEQGSSCDWVTRADALSSTCVGLMALIARAEL
jgi:NUDIX domain-containing protein